jgi:hypothetical protein
MDLPAAVFVTNSWFLVLIAEMLLLIIIRSSSLILYTGILSRNPAGQTGGHCFLCRDNICAHTIITLVNIIGGNRYIL